jgi:hypothetical protein
MRGLLRSETRGVRYHHTRTSAEFHSRGLVRKAAYNLVWVYYRTPCSSFLSRVFECDPGVICPRSSCKHFAPRNRPSLQQVCFPFPSCATPTTLFGLAQSGIQNRLCGLTCSPEFIAKSCGAYPNGVTRLPSPTGPRNRRSRLPGKRRINSFSSRGGPLRSTIHRKRTAIISVSPRP